MSFNFKTAEQWALLYEDAITKLVGGGFKSITLPTGVSYSTNDLPFLEKQYEYWKKQAYRSKYGINTVMDFSK